ncbi:MAG: protein-glutamate O-methyltransferase CheR [Chloroflexia bacterium]|nr:protein-glutamate O-methyltransferase CheR [Chloroflexia bacterium]
MEDWAALLQQIRQERGLDLRAYKETFLRRRLDVRLRARDCADYAAYARLLRQEPQEYRPLLDALTINLTRFFRDGSTFQALEERILPQLLAARSAERRLRVWSAGCAAGEEPYSLAIMLRELLGPALSRWQMELLATDMDETMLAKAAQGCYDSFSFRGVAPRYEAWVERYFTPGPERQLAQVVRDMVSFRQHNLLQDPLPERLDLLLCRNVLIYFERELHGRLYQAFHRALRPGGFLVLGKTEVLSMSWSHYFPVVETREHIYRRAEV